MNFLTGFSLRKLLYNKRFMVPFSIIMAFIIWLVIIIEKKPTMERTFTNIPVSINLEDTNAAKTNMSIIGDFSSQRFTVVVRGSSSVVSTLTSADFSLYASAAEVDSPGNKKLKVSVLRDSNTANYEILSIYPPEVSVDFDYIDKKEFTLSAIAEGATVPIGTDLIVDSAFVSGIESDKVTVEGPRTVINKINSVVATANVNKELTVSETFDANLILYDDDGAVISSENLIFTGVEGLKVTVPISKEKVVPVKVSLSNLPVGFDKSSIPFTVDHPTVTIIGTPDTVDKTTQIELSPIDITQVSLTSKSFDVAPKLPEGVRLLDSIDHFTVNFNLNNYIEKKFTINSTLYTGISAGLSANGNTEIRNVKICGPRSVVNKIKITDIYAEINLTDKKEGKYSVNPVINFKNYSNVWAVGSYTVTVTIK